MSDTRIWPAETERETNRHATTAIIYAFLGWTVLSLFGSVMALFYAGRAEREIAAAPDRFRGRQLARSARSHAKAQIVLFLVLITLVVLAFGVFRTYVNTVTDEVTASVGTSETAPLELPAPPPEPEPVAEEPLEPQREISRADFAEACSVGYGGGDPTPCECTYDELRVSGYTDEDLVELAADIELARGITNEVAEVIEGCGASTD